MPTSAEMTLLDADLMLASRAGRAPLKYRSTINEPRQLTRRLCSRGRSPAAFAMASTSIGGADICPGAGERGSASAVTQTIAPITTGINRRKTNT